MSRKSRLGSLSTIPILARVDSRLLIRDQESYQANLATLTRKERRELKRHTKRVCSQYNKILKKISKMGAGFHVDQLFRQMAIEYTHRFASSGTYTQPTSFYYFESFYNIKLIKNSYAPYVELTNEIDHLFDPSDFFDYLTSSDSDQFKTFSPRKSIR